MQNTTGLEATVEEALALIPSETSKEDPEMWSVEHVSQTKPDLYRPEFVFSKRLLNVYFLCRFSSRQSGVPFSRHQKGRGMEHLSILSA